MKYGWNFYSCVFIKCHSSQVYYLKIVSRVFHVFTKLRKGFYISVEDYEDEWFMNDFCYIDISTSIKDSATSLSSGIVENANCESSDR